jgi:myo-inositol 2-dehydrogenase/D-chiro-inositol 1-dehydrogenase
LTPERIPFGLIGAGRIGALHAESLASRLPEAELVAVADIYRPAAEALARRWRIPAVFDDYRAVLEDPQIAAVAICSATDTHARIIREAAAAGKHIFCEKPIDHNLAEIDAALRAVEAAGVQLQVGFNRRFDANFKKVRDLVHEGRIGVPHLLRITSRDPAPPPLDYIRVSGGIFLDMTIHDFDMARYLMGSEVTQVFTAGGVMVDEAIGAAGDLDTAMITLWFENGAIGTIDNSRQAVYGYDQRVEVFGSQGMARADNNYPDTHVLSHAGGVEMAKPLYFFLERYMDSYIAEMDAFIEALRTGGPVPVNGEDGRIPVVMGLAARRSYIERRPVLLSEVV